MTATFVLVHGAFRGSWSWSRLQPELARRGHSAVAPELTGLGSQRVRSQPSVGLDTHIEDVTEAMSSIDGEIILVGASYGGMVITGAAAKQPEMVKQLIFLDAAVPRAGDSMMMMMDPARRLEILDSATTDGQGWLIPGKNSATFDAMTPTDAETIRRNLCSQPLLTFLQPIRFDEADLSHIPRAFIRCAHPASRPSPVSRSAERAQESPEWQYVEIPGHHDVMFTSPALVADALEDLIRAV